MKLVAPGKSITLSAVRPNEGVRMDYQGKVIALVNKMHDELLHGIKEIYPNLPGIAQDYATVKQLSAMMEHVAAEWKKKFAVESKKIALAFANHSMKATDVSFATGLRKAGFTVKMQMTQPIQNMLDTLVSQNVALIRSIGEQHLADVQGMVMRSVQGGRSMGELTKNLGNLVKLNRKPLESDVSLLARTKRRAAFIARDQNNKATANIHRARQRQYGITHAKWLHTMASVHPRETHAEFNGETYAIEDGHDFNDDLGPVIPGEAFNCGCCSISIIPGMEDVSEKETSEEQAS